MPALTREQIIFGTPWEPIARGSHNWLFNRPTMVQHNSDPAWLLKAFVGETVEARDEHGIAGREQSHASETGDALSVLTTLSTQHGYLPNYDDVRPYVNGQGERSRVYDEIQETAADIKDGNVEKPVLHIATALFSLMAHNPEPQSPPKVMEKTRKKNGTMYEGNYPEIYFSDEDPELLLADDNSVIVYSREKRKLLNPDDKKASYDHSYFCLRFIRDALECIGEQRFQGLLMKDHWDFRKLIWNFRNPEARSLLQIAVAARHGISVEKIVQYQNDKKR